MTQIVRELHQSNWMEIIALARKSKTMLENSTNLLYVKTEHICTFLEHDKTKRWQEKERS